MSSPLTRAALRRTTTAAAVVATTAAAAVVPALTTSPAHAGTKATTSLSIRTLKTVVSPGERDTVTGDLVVHGPALGAGRTVTLEAKPQGSDSFTPVADAVSGDRGGLHVKVNPQTTTRYRWHYAGDTDARGSASGIATIRVRAGQHHPNRLPTTLAVRAAHRVVGPRGADLIRGRLQTHRVPVRHRWVVLVSRTPDRPTWAFVGAHRTGVHGQTTFRVQPRQRTAYRLAFLGTPLLQPTRSAIVRVGVRPTVSIAADPVRIDRGQSSTVSGAVTTGGVAVAGATVKLLTRRVGADHPLRAVGSGTTAADGSVSFAVSPLRAHVYRLRVVPSAASAGGLSPRIRVFVRFPSSLSIRGVAHPAAYTVLGLLRGHRHPLRNRVVTLEAQAPGSVAWTVVGSGRTGPHGVVKFKQPVAPGTGYRLSYAGAPRFGPTTSGTVVQ